MEIGVLDRGTVSYQVSVPSHMEWMVDREMNVIES